MLGCVTTLLVLFGVEVADFDINEVLVVQFVHDVLMVCRKDVSRICLKECGK